MADPIRAVLTPAWRLLPTATVHCRAPPSAASGAGGRLRQLSNGTLRIAAHAALAGVFVLATAAVHGADAVNVTVTAARIGTLVDRLSLTGTVTAEQSASLSPRVSGLVASVHVDAGDHVRAGDVLVELDATMARLALAESEAAIAEGQARLAEAERLRREAQRLAKTQSVAATQLEASDSAVKVSAAAVARLEAQRRAQAETIARHALIAPFDGVVTRKLTEAGEWIETGTAAIELVAIDRLRLDVQVPQERYHDIADDTPVEVRLDALPGQSFSGRILRRVPVKDTSARSFLVRVGVEGGEGRMTPGMSAEAVFRVRSSRKTLTLPKDAIVRRPDGTASVWLLVETDGATRVRERPIEIGRSAAERVEVESGLEAGDRVIMRGNEVLREGQLVHVVRDESPEEQVER